MQSRDACHGNNHGRRVKEMQMQFVYIKTTFDENIGHTWKMQLDFSFIS